jgi:putative ABC transport system permease protein
MDSLLLDLRYAVRSLLQAKTFTVAATVCLALGISANVIVFTAVNTLLLRPLPYVDADRLVLVHTRSASGGELENLSYPEYRDLGSASGAFAATSAQTNRWLNLGGITEPERLKASFVTASLFPMLGLRPVVGRSFRTDEEEGDARVVLLSDALWQRRFGGDRRVVGRTVTLNGVPHAVIGVMPPGILYPENTQLWLPINPGPAKERREWRQYEVVARLAPGVTVEMASRRIREIMQRIAQQHPETNAGIGGWARPYREQVASQVRPMMRILLGAVAFVMLVACANVAGLLLARATARAREIGVRRALGAGRGRIVRQLLTESTILGLIGGTLGTLIGVWGLDAVRAMLPLDDLPFWMTFEVDGTVLLFTLAASLVSALLFGLAPALHVTRQDVTTSLRDSGRGVTADGRTGRLRAALVVGQLTLSLVLLAGATLMMRSFVRMTGADPGFRAAPVLAFETSLQGTRYGSDSAVVAGYDALTRRLAAIPGVAAVGAASQLPITSCCSWTQYYPGDKDYRPADAPTAYSTAVTPSYFDALGIPLLAGRVFHARDRHGAPRVVVVNRSLVEREWPGQEPPIGKQIKLNPADSLAWTVVGVVADTKQRELTDVARPHVYLPHAQATWRSLSVLLRARDRGGHSDPAALASAARAAVRAFDPDVPVTQLRPMAEAVRRRMFQPRVYSTMFAIMGAGALVLASVGLYGVIAYSVLRRTHEIGIRVALGATSRDVLQLIVSQGARLILVGLLLGVPAALALARVLRGALYGVSTADPATFVSIPALLAGVALLASYIPARRATKIDATEALRTEG